MRSGEYGVGSAAGILRRGARRGRRKRRCRLAGARASTGCGPPEQSAEHVAGRDDGVAEPAPASATTSPSWGLSGATCGRARSSPSAASWRARPSRRRRPRRREQADPAGRRRSRRARLGRRAAQAAGGGPCATAAQRLDLGELRDGGRGDEPALCDRDGGHRRRHVCALSRRRMASRARAGSSPAQAPGDPPGTIGSEGPARRISGEALDRDDRAGAREREDDSGQHGSCDADAEGEACAEG